jgi:hypothetical protein
VVSSSRFDAGGPKSVSRSWGTSSTKKGFFESAGDLGGDRRPSGPVSDVGKTTGGVEAAFQGLSLLEPLVEAE